MRSPGTASGDGYKERALGLPVLILYPAERGASQRINAVTLETDDAYLVDVVHGGVLEFNHSV